MRFPSTTFTTCACTLTIALICVLAPGVAVAAATTDAICANAFTLEISPGFSLTPGMGTNTTGGERGTLFCTGVLRGHPITGRGTVGVQESYTHSTCLADRSSGQVAVTIPTTAGVVHMVGALDGRRAGLLEFVEIAFPGAHFGGSGPVLPTAGDCVLAPITQALVSIEGTLRS
jgi:hypothetical protein